MNKHRKDAIISTIKQHSFLETNHRIFNKPNLRASGLSLLPLALRPGLLMVGGLVVTGLVAITGLVSSSSVSAASISLSVPNKLSLNINSASPSGTFSKSDKATVSTKTDSKNGYTLSIKSKEDIDSNCLKNDNNNNKLESISSSISESEYESSGQMNTWAYQPEMFNSIANSNFLPGPNSSETVLDKTKVGNDLVHNYGIVLAAKVNTDLPAGSYKNTYVLTATSNALTYSVHYNLNDGQGGPSPNPQTGQLDGDTFKLDGTVPTKEGLEFKGWCTVQPSEDGSCSGGIYQPGSTFTIYCDENNIELYAMWEESEPTLQNFKCTLAGNQINAIEDKRDGTKYTVAKLKDGKCWMTENLRIQNMTLTKSDSDVLDNFVLPASTDKPNANSFYDSKELHVDATYGGYYTWFTATAGEGNQSFDSGDTQHSICPKGWRLPTKDEYVTLLNMYSVLNNPAGAITLQGDPFYFKMGGYYLNGFNNSVGGDALYWSSTAYNTYSAYDLSFNSGGTNPQTNYDKRSPLSVCCVARQ